jgi:thiosulfate/3-mercaptopyruvate sulfurtransferase
MHHTLLTVDQLHALASAPIAAAPIQSSSIQSNQSALAIVDCRFDLADTAAGRRAYVAGHIPGAYYAHLDQDLSGGKTAITGRHPLPEPSAFATLCGRWGIGGDTQVVAYDADTGAFAARLWWLLRWLGHRRVAVLNGGYRAWVDAGLPVSSVEPPARSATFVPRPDPERVTSTQEVAQLVNRPDWRVLDARAPERFSGAVEPIDPVAGHVPGARNYPFASNLSVDGMWLPPEQLAAQFKKSLDGVAGERSIMMCGSGVTACHNLLAMEVAGIKGAKLYAGSWSEWIRDPTRPVELGAGAKR